MRVHEIKLTDRQITLVRVAMLQRLDRLKENMEGRNPLHAGDKLSLAILQASYDDTKAMLVETGVLSMASLKEAPLLREVLAVGAEIGSQDRQV